MQLDGDEQYRLDYHERCGNRQRVGQLYSAGQYEHDQPNGNADRGWADGDRHSRRSSLQLHSHSGDGIVPVERG